MDYINILIGLLIILIGILIIINKDKFSEINEPTLTSGNNINGIVIFNALCNNEPMNVFYNGKKLGNLSNKEPIAVILPIMYHGIIPNYVSLSGLNNNKNYVFSVNFFDKFKTNKDGKYTNTNCVTIYRDETIVTNNVISYNYNIFKNLSPILGSMPEYSDSSRSVKFGEFFITSLDDAYSKNRTSKDNARIVTVKPTTQKFNI
jgi:hypothetical protein